MAFIPNQQINTGFYVPTTNVWEINNISQVDINSDEFRLLLVRLYQNINLITIALNAKDSALYDTQQFVNGQQFFSTNPANPTEFRSCFRLVVNVGPLGPGATTTAHNLSIQTQWTFTRIYGVATDTSGGNYYPLPWASAAGATNIELKLDNTNVVITNNSGVVFSRCIVVVEYLKN